MKKTNTEELDKMIDEATVDAYDDYEQFMGVLYYIESNLSFPFKAKVLGDTIEVIGVDDHQSSMGRGIVAKVRKQGREYNISLADLELDLNDKKNAPYFELYHYWISKY